MVQMSCGQREQGMSEEPKGWDGWRTGSEEKWPEVRDERWADTGLHGASENI